MYEAQLFWCFGGEKKAELQRRKLLAPAFSAAKPPSPCGTPVGARGTLPRGSQHQLLGRKGGRDDVAAVGGVVAEVKLLAITAFVADKGRDVDHLPKPNRILVVGVVLDGVVDDKVAEDGAGVGAVAPLKVLADLGVCGRRQA